MLKLKNTVRQTVIAASLLLSALSVAQTTQAKGGAVFTTAPGSCNVAGATATAVDIKANNLHQFALQVVGPDSVGTWTIAWTKDGVFNSNTSMVIPPPGGWSVVGLSTVPGQKGTVSFSAVATSTTGTVCTAAISVKI